MGLLTDPAGHGKPTQIIVKYHKTICFVLYVASLVWFCLLASNSFNAGKLIIYWSLVLPKGAFSDAARETIKFEIDNL